ncbi:MAG TPA: endolytic transglycosylase MltG [Candidatus Saccharimonadales bacterium]|nr:endolytic transglycosylase MltG [Candidatus Saccharimonadales bacterium]
MDGFKPQKRPLGPQNTPLRPTDPSMSPNAPIAAQRLQQVAPDLQPPVLDVKPPKKSRKRLVLWITGGIVALLAILTLGGLTWYKASLTPVNSNDKSRTRVEIVSGSSPAQIARLLEEKKLIRSQFAFDIYTRITGKRATLQAGTYNLSPSESTEDIVGHIVSGRTDEFNLTFLPGATLAENRTKLIAAGYSEAEVDAALNKNYTHPLFQDKPESADLEGYIYGETYNFSSSATVEDILTKTFDEYYSTITENNLIDGFKAHGLDLYQGITLASIIQREVSNKNDQKQVAQVFYSRLNSGMALGSDVTYQYAAKKLGVDPSPSLDSPYNTRKYPGLPPGPIATPGLSALEAVAGPASGDYLYFLSGDDDVTYFARTNEEHEANIRDHCKVKCLIP